MKILKKLKPIALAVIAIGISISSIAAASANNKLTFCYSYSGSTMVLNPTPLQAGDKCPSNGGFIYARDYKAAQAQINKANQGNQRVDCENFKRQCLKTLEVRSHTKAELAREVCDLKQKVCMDPNNKKLNAKFQERLNQLNPDVANMIENLRPE